MATIKKNDDWIAWLEKQGEQKPIEYPLCKTIKDKIDYYITNHFIADEVTKTTVNDIVNAMKEGVRLGREEQNPAWSEEDERMFNSALWHVKNSCGNGGKNSGEFEVYNWLKDLKDRVQPKQEWKQENTGDLTDFENAMMHIGRSFFGENAGLDPNDTNAIKEQANLLLELVSSKEWSEEDKKKLLECCSIIKQWQDKQDDYYYEGKFDYAAWLKG